MHSAQAMTASSHAPRCAWMVLPDTTRSLPEGGQDVRVSGRIGGVLGSPTEEILQAHDAFVDSDSHPFMRVGRLRQALWREWHGFPVGLRLKMPNAQHPSLELP